MSYNLSPFTYNENKRFAERYLPFNIDELKKVASNAINKPETDVTSLQKLAEGGFNRIFEVRMQDGTSVLARLPYPSTFPRRLAVASEVATMDFVRTRGVPTPLVLGYAVDENPVGSEYILMEKLPGRPMGDAWIHLSAQERLKVLLHIVKFEAKLFAINLPASGSIYYARDLSPGTPKYLTITFVDDDPRLVLQTPAEKELAWIRAYARPRFPFDRAYRETFDYKRVDPKDHANSLADYIRLAPYLVPTCPKLNQPVLRHPDLQPNNIFVSEDFSITGLIDWQHSLVLPTFLAAGMPRSFQNYDDQQSMSFVPPQLPHDFDSMDEDERAEVREQFRRRHVHFFYLGFTQRMNEAHWHALEQETGLLKRRIFDHASSPWEGLNTPLQMDTALVLQHWSKIARTNPDGTVPVCPVEVSEQGAQRRAALDESLREVDSEMERINGVLGIASDGWTPNESFENAREKARFIREERLAAVADEPWLKEMTEQHWPFDDWDEEL
ncbi:kinase-like protein [Decorospora gaudefroyi]|uniref:Kinase-like protein n=1 Tax=Decorospora gaudefroyi TaxID=184978 RepID=A0A6A5KFL9_9PLEO|nr:kinase-like protein [Decorospora gaudefroyi]